MNTLGSLVDALHHPLRREVLRFLQQRSTGSASEIARELGVQVGNLSYHVRRLARLGLIEEVHSVRHRGALMRVYRTSSAYREVISFLLSEQPAQLAAAALTDQRITVVQLDEEGIDALSQDVERVSDRMRDLHERTLRRARDARTAGPRSQVTLLVVVAPLAPT